VRLNSLFARRGRIACCDRRPGVPAAAGLNTGPGAWFGHRGMKIRPSSFRTPNSRPPVPSHTQTGRALVANRPATGASWIIRESGIPLIVAANEAFTSGRNSCMSVIYRIILEKSICSRDREDAVGSAGAKFRVRTVVFGLIIGALRRPLRLGWPRNISDICRRCRRNPWRRPAVPSWP
jgi:hypothetical protein